MMHRIEEPLDQVNISGFATAAGGLAQALPRPCQACGQPACYGRKGIWACLPCWIITGFWKRQWPTRSTT